MSNIEIPDEALDASGMASHWEVSPIDRMHILVAAAPFIVAAELERLAKELPGSWVTNHEYQTARYDAYRYLVNRAAELRGESNG